MEFKNYTATKNKQGDIYLEDNNIGGIHTGNKAILLPDVSITPQQSAINIAKDIKNNYKFNNPYLTDKPLSGTDPIGQFIVENIALGPAYKLAGKAALYGAGRLGSNYARAKLLSETMNKNLTSPLQVITNQTKTQLPIINKNNSSPYLGLLERQQNISLQERLGVPKEIRNRIYKSNPNAGAESNVNTYLINRSNTPYDFSEGNLRWKTGSSIGSTDQSIRTTSHFTTDQPVIANSGGEWDSASETLITPYKQMVMNNGNPVSIEPMDTYFTSPNALTINRSGTKILTGDKKNYLKYKSQGIDAEYSKESQDILNKLRQLPNRGELQMKALDKNISEDERKNIYDKIHDIYKQENDLLEKNRNIHSQWVQKQNPPTVDTYKTMSQETNINNPVKPRIQNYNYQINNPDIDYSPQPSVHSDSWLGTAEHDIKKGVNQFIKQVQSGQSIPKENLPTFQYYFNKLGIKPTYRLPQNIQHSDVINRILSGERVFKYKEGGVL